MRVSGQGGVVYTWHLVCHGVLQLLPSPGMSRLFAPHLCGISRSALVVAHGRPPQRWYWLFPPLVVGSLIAVAAVMLHSAPPTLQRYP